MADTKLQLIPHMNSKSCCCFSSKTGCLIIGYSGAIISSIFAIPFLIGAVSMLFTDYPFIFIPFILISGIFMAVFYIHYSLVQGVEKQEPRKMYLWIYLHYISLIVNAFSIGWGFIVLIAVLVSGNSVEFSNGKEKIPAAPVIFFYLCSLAISTGIGYHIFASIVTHCQDLISMQSHGRVYTP